MADLISMLTSALDYVTESWLFVPILAFIGFIISITLNIVQKYIYVNFKFTYSLWLMATHMCASYLIAVFAIYYLNMVPNRKVLTFKEQIWAVFPFSALGALTLALGNWSLLYIYPSFGAMLQNTTPFWTVIMCILIKQEKFPLMVYISMIPVCIGGMLAVSGELSTFNTIGLFLSLSAAAVRAMKTVLQSALLRDNDAGKLDSITLLYYSAPLNLGLFVSSSLIIEGGIQPYIDFMQLDRAGILFICGNACAAALYNILWFYVISRWGAVLTSVVGNSKVPTTALLSFLVFGNPISVMQLCSFLVTMFGTYCYNQSSKGKPIFRPILESLADMNFPGTSSFRNNNSHNVNYDQIQIATPEELKGMQLHTRTGSSSADTIGVSSAVSTTSDGSDIDEKEVSNKKHMVNQTIKNMVNSY